MKNPFRDLFYFPRGDRRAVVALGCIAVVCIWVYVVADAMRGGGEVSSEGDGNENVSRRKSDGSVGNKLKNNDMALNTFDPNTVDSLSLISFGISPWKVRNFLHYRAAGKVFRSAEDIGDTYGWTEKDVEMLAPYICVASEYGEKKRYAGRNAERNFSADGKAEEESGGVKTKNGDIFTGGGKRDGGFTSSKFRTLTRVDANTADSATLCRIPGIGGGISSAIIRYRARLGGFYSVRQLNEISIFSPELLEWFTVSDVSALKKLPINQSSFHALNSHPYITYDQARNLLKYIRLYGIVEDEKALIATGIFTDEEIEKLRPYIEY